MTPSGPTAQEGKGITQREVTQLECADQRYPAWLRAIHDPPAVLYCDGLPETGDRQAVAIVGSRRATPYGLRVTEALAGELSRLGFTIVSGFARDRGGGAPRGPRSTGTHHRAARLRAGRGLSAS